MCGSNGIPIKNGFIHTGTLANLRRTTTIGCLREMDVVDMSECFSRPAVLEPPAWGKWSDMTDDEDEEEGITTLKLRNLLGKFNLDRILKELLEVGIDFDFVRLFPRQGTVRAYAYVVFPSAAAAKDFQEAIVRVHGRGGKTLATGGLHKRNAVPAKIQGATGLIQTYGHLSIAPENTWVA